MQEAKELAKAYDPKDHEDQIYQEWIESGIFNPDTQPNVDPALPPFSMVLPPPNVTGTLHMGHAVMLAIEDAMARFARLSGRKTLWLPGTDHAAIATESKVEKLLIEKEGKTRHDLGREAFLKRVDQFAQESHDTIVGQMKKMGASVDWSREAFTLDAKRNGAVNEAFKRMFEDGLIYKGYRVVNWDPTGQTTVSDDEVEYKEVKAKLYTFRYAKDFPIAIATTRPETKVGDTAVAVHPEGKWKDYIGQTFEVEFAGAHLTIKVVGDLGIDPEFGTGALGVTPAHSQTDDEIARKNDLPTITVIGRDGKMTSEAGTLVAGKTTLEAREAVVAWLRENDLLEGEVEIDQNLSVAQRSGGAIEPMPMEQWFIAVNKEFTRDGKTVTLKSLMQDAVRSEAIEILPERFEKTYFHWIDNLRDWNISRQIWYGHRVPVWRCVRCGKNHVQKNIIGKWYFVRHGESTANVQNLHQGQGSSPLTKKGHEQARAAGRALASHQLDLIISSDLVRAKQTAEAIAEETGVPLVFEPAFREREIGEMEGMHRDEAEERYGDHRDPETKIPGAETYEALEERILTAFHEHASNQKGKNIAIVAHGGVIRMLEKVARAATHKESAQWPQKPNGSFLVFDYSDEACACEGNLFEQDSDTLDTWFSSGLWTFSTLGWPEKTEDLKAFHPTSVLETGYDILFFWVARMILMSTYLVGEVPFKTVYLHGLVRDEQGRKMSKSLGNIINPLDMIEKYGADATRLSLLVGATPGNDTRLSEEKIAGFRNFTNKLWNISRFVFMTVGTPKVVVRMPEPVTLADKWILDALAKTVAKATEHYQAFEYSQVGELLREFTWNQFADWYVEVAKTQASERTNEILLFVLERILLLWHPFMPFVTEAVYREFGNGSISTQRLEAIDFVASDNDLPQFTRLQEAVTFVRNTRARYTIPYTTALTLVTSEEAFGEEERAVLQLLAKVGTVEVGVAVNAKESAQAVVQGMTIALPLSGIVDFEAEKARMEKELARLEKFIATQEAQLQNEGFVKNAKPEIIEERKASVEKAKADYQTLKNELI